MNKQTWIINETTGTIPGIAGEWHAGQEIDVDMDTMTVLAVRLRNKPTLTITGTVNGIANVSEVISMPDPTQVQEPMSQPEREVPAVEELELSSE